MFFAKKVIYDFITDTYVVIFSPNTPNIPHCSMATSGRSPAPFGVIPSETTKCGLFRGESKGLTPDSPRLVPTRCLKSGDSGTIRRISRTRRAHAPWGWQDLL